MVWYEFVSGNFLFGSKQMFTWKYNQQTKQWDVILKENKAYEYIPILTAKIVYSRMPDEDIMTRNISLNATDPCLMVPTNATNLLLQNCSNGSAGSVCHLKALKQTKMSPRKIPSAMEHRVVLFLD